MVEDIEYAEDMAKLNNKTRVKLKWYLPALAFALCLQRKRWWGWKTTAWIYPDIMQNKSHEYTVHWLFWEEGNRNIIPPSNYSTGREIIKKIYSQPSH